MRVIRQSWNAFGSESTREDARFYLLEVGERKHPAYFQRCLIDQKNKLGVEIVLA